MKTLSEKENRRVLELSFEYFELLDKAKALLKIANARKEQILLIASPGRYGRYSVYKVKKTLIEVRAYTRHSYCGIRRGKPQ